MRTYSAVWMTGLALSLILGCQSGERYEFNRRTFRFERVGPRPRPTVASTEEPAPAPGKEGEMGRIPPRTGPGGTFHTINGQRISPRTEPGTGPVALTPKQKSAYVRGRVQRLYIGDPTAESTIAPENLFVPKQTTPNPVAELLVVVFPGQGPGGSDRLRYLLYSNDEVWSRAKAFVRRLDVAPLKPDAGSDGRNTWDQAIGLVYGSEFPRRMDPQVRFRAVGLLNQVMADRSADLDLRWAAGLIAANLQSRFDPKDSIAASALLSRTSELVRGSDYRALVVRYHYLRQLEARDQKLTLRKKAEECLKTYRRWEDTDCYQFIRNYLESK